MSFQLKKIKDVGKVFTGKTPSKAVEGYFGGDIPFVTPAELDKEQFVFSSQQTLTQLGAEQIKLLPEKAVMVCCIGSLGKIGIVGKELATNQQINSVVFDDKQIDFKYGFYALSRLKPLMERIAPLTTVPIINKSNFEQLEIPVPPLDTQTQIAKILDKSTALIAKRKAQIAELDVLVQSVFLEMFGDPITNSKNWEMVKFIDVVKLQRGFDLPVQNRIEGKYNVWGSNGVVATHSEYKVKGGGIITGRSGSIGNVYYTKEDYFPLNTTLFSVDTKGNNIIYLAYLVKNFKLDRFQTGTGVPTLNRNNVHEEYTINVPLELQTQFAQIVEKIQTQKSQLQQSLAELEMQHQALMQRAFRGELV